MPDENAFHQRKVDTEAELIANHIKHNEIDEARVRLAEDYLTMSPSQFKKVLNEVTTQHNDQYEERNDPSALVRKIHSEKVFEYYKHGKDVLLDDHPIDDTRLIGILRDIRPRSTPLQDPSLEQAARRFNSILGKQNAWSLDASETSYRKYGADVMATRALLNYAYSLPESQRTLLLTRTEEINVEFGSSDSATLDIVTADMNGDNVPAEIKTVRLNLTLNDGNARLRYRSYGFVIDGKRLGK